MKARAIVLLAAIFVGAALLGSTTARGSSEQVESTFPAAGTLNVTKVGVRSAPNPHAHVIKVMHQFRTDYRIQEIFAVALRDGSDGRPWYKISIPMRPNG